MHSDRLQIRYLVDIISLIIYLQSYIIAQFMVNLWDLVEDITSCIFTCVFNLFFGFGKDQEVPRRDKKKGLAGLESPIGPSNRRKHEKIYMMW